MGDVQVVEQTDFTGGINAQGNPYLVAPNQVMRMTNLMLTRFAGIQTRDGTTTRDTIGANTDQVLARFSWSRSDNTLIQMALVHNSVSGNVELWAQPAGIWTLMGAMTTTGVLGTFIPQIVIFNDVAIIGDGYNVPKTSRGSVGSFASLAGTALATPSGVTALYTGPSGSSTWSYRVTAENAAGSTVGSSTVSITNAAASLNALTAAILITWNQVTNASQYGVYRTAAPTGFTTGRIATVGATEVSNTTRTTVTFLDAGTLGLTSGRELSVVPDASSPPGADSTTLVIGGAQLLKEHLGAVWAFNTAATNSADGLDGPSSLRQSLVADATTWPRAYQTWIDKDNGEPGTGLASFSIAESGVAPDPFLVAFKTFSTYVIGGSFGPNGQTPTIQRAKTDMGCVAPNSIQFVSTPRMQGLIRLTHRGFALFDGVNDTVISDPIRPYVFGGQGNVTGIATILLNASSAVLVPNPPMYICACSAVTGGLDRVFCYDLSTGGWTILTFAQNFTCLGEIESAWGANTPSIIVAGQFGGNKTFTLFNGASTDDGTTINWDFLPAPIGRPGEVTYYHRVLMSVYNFGSGQTITGNFATGARGERQNFIRTVGMTEFAGLLSEVNAYAWPEGVLPFEMGAVGDVLWAIYSGTGFVNIRALHYQVRPKGRRRPVTP